MENEIDLIQHLLEVEKNASLMLKDAQKEADQLTAKARSEAEIIFKSEYSKIIENIESKESVSKEELQKIHDIEFNSFTERLNNLEKDRNAFVTAFEKALEM